MVWKLVYADRDSHYLPTFSTPLTSVTFISNLFSSDPLYHDLTYIPFYIPPFSRASGVTSFTLLVLL